MLKASKLQDFTSQTIQFLKIHDQDSLPFKTLTLKGTDGLYIVARKIVTSSVP